MHDCSAATGDTWLKTHLDAYIRWANTHNSLLSTPSLRGWGGG